MVDPKDFVTGSVKNFGAVRAEVSLVLKLYEPSLLNFFEELVKNSEEVEVNDVINYSCLLPGEEVVPNQDSSTVKNERTKLFEKLLVVCLQVPNILPWESGVIVISVGEDLFPIEQIGA